MLRALKKLKWSNGSKLWMASREVEMKLVAEVEMQLVGLQPVAVEVKQRLEVRDPDEADQLPETIAMFRDLPLKVSRDLLATKKIAYYKELKNL